jgi:hypothetical protein
MNTKIYPVLLHKGKIRIGLEILEKDAHLKAVGKGASKPPEALKFKIPTIQKPINPDETL